VTTISNVVAIAAGYQHAIAIRADRTLWTWGDNGVGELGRSDVNGGYDPLPAQVSGLSNVVAIAGGNQFSLAVTNSGQLFGFGDNNDGQLGNTDTVDHFTSPVMVAGITNVVLVSANSSGDDAGYHSLAMTSNHGTNQYHGWGYNSHGQVGSTGGNVTNGSIYVPTPEALQFCSDVQLGTGGVFTATCTGTLLLFFNDNQNDFNDNSGAYTATVGVVSNIIVQALFSSGVATGIVAGIVSNGVTYSYSATGLCTWSTSCTASPDCTTDANGNHTNGVPADCVAANWTPGRCTAPCPTLQCFSLVGKIVPQ
jgi:hypothetical protein